ncbi:UNVERIFIED_CONTAM: hypothetical protein K2H54_041440 [Gekko kuhli]
MYVVELAGGKIWRRHVDQLRQRWARSSLDVESAEVSDPDEQPIPPPREVSDAAPSMDTENKIVDQCETLQLQSAVTAKYVAEVLPEKKQHVVSAASSAREVLIRRLNLVRSVCESEEQRLLEMVHTEEERAHQNILTQQVHWTESLRKLDALRTYLVAMITATDDRSLVQAEEEIYERMEEAEGILKPQESEKLNFNPQCIQSPLMSRLWAAAVLCWNSAQMKSTLMRKQSAHS